MAKITIREAARLVGKDRTTLYRYIESGDLSIMVENRGKQVVKVVDTAD
jgi:predicted site-specific integrase-resolvase